MFDDGPGAVGVKVIGPPDPDLNVRSCCLICGVVRNNSVSIPSHRAFEKKCPSFTPSIRELLSDWSESSVPDGKVKVPEGEVVAALLVEFSSPLDRPFPIEGTDKPICPDT